uniref:(northern house mosquito) hypothetical protein n=1 Tax=Culex pipiens TaxID=7175 RepID=A0A8D8HAE8_CULPI
MCLDADRFHPGSVQQKAGVPLSEPGPAGLTPFNIGPHSVGNVLPSRRLGTVPLSIVKTPMLANDTHQPHVVLQTILRRFTPKLQVRLQKLQIRLNPVRFNFRSFLQEHRVPMS